MCYPVVTEDENGKRDAAFIEPPYQPRPASTILGVDDLPNILRSLYRLLHMEDSTLSTAGSPGEALMIKNLFARTVHARSAPLRLNKATIYAQAYLVMSRSP